MLGITSHIAAQESPNGQNVIHIGIISPVVVLLPKYLLRRVRALLVLLCLLLAAAGLTLRQPL